jgi:hypothetical protein
MRGTIANPAVATSSRNAAEIHIRKGCSDANCGKYQGVVSYKGGQWQEQLIGGEIFICFTASVWEI